VTLAEPVEAGVLDASMSPQWSTEEICGRQPSMAVLPFGYVGGGAGDAYFAEDILESIIASLTDLKELVAIARSSRAAYAFGHLDVREVGQTLGVRYVLSGSVRRSTTTVRVTAELRDAEFGLTIWADTTEVLLGERFNWHDRIAQRIAAAVVPHIRDEELRRFCHASRHAAGSTGSAFLGLPLDGAVGADCDGLRRL
jgi:TolB-like protein